MTGTPWVLVTVVGSQAPYSKSQAARSEAMGTPQVLDNLKLDDEHPVSSKHPTTRQGMFHGSQAPHSRMMDILWVLGTHSETVGTLWVLGTPQWDDGYPMDPGHTGAGLRAPYESQACHGSWHSTAEQWALSRVRDPRGSYTPYTRTMGTPQVQTTPQWNDGPSMSPGHPQQHDGHPTRMLRRAMFQPHPYHLCPQVHLGLAGGEGG